MAASAPVAGLVLAQNHHGALGAVLVLALIEGAAKRQLPAHQRLGLDEGDALGRGEVVQGVLGGQVPILFDQIPAPLPHIRAGKLRALAVAAERRSPFLPEVPTLADTLPGFNASVWFGIVAPPKTPEAIAAKLNGAIAEILRQPDVVTRFAGLAAHPVGGSLKETADFIAAERKLWSRIVAEAGIKPE